MSLALLFNAALYFYVGWTLEGDPQRAGAGVDADEAAWQIALEFLTGYLVEYSLSVDNIFVFVLVLRYFAVPPRQQHRVLFYGILGALVFRGVFIALGSVLMQFHWVVWLFGDVPDRHRREDGDDLARPPSSPTAIRSCGSCVDSSRSRAASTAPVPDP